MSRQSPATKQARQLEKLYGTKAKGVRHMTVLRLVNERGFQGAMDQLIAWGHSPLEDAACGREDLPGGSSPTRARRSNSVGHATAAATQVLRRRPGVAPSKA